MATLDEVARLAGVSRTTASRAINGGAKVSAKAQKAVDDAVRTLGFSPNTAARSLASRRTGSVALVLPEPDERVFADPFFARALQLVTTHFAARDLQVVLLIAQPGEEAQRMLRYLSGRPVDGVVVASHHRADGLATHLADLEMPSVFIGRPWTGDDRVSYVDSDNISAGRRAARLLIDRGCRRIAHIAGPADMHAGADRLEGWRLEVGEAGLPTDAVAPGDFTMAGGQAACRHLLDTHPGVDAIFAASDLMAVGAVRELTTRGLRVPDDVAVVGYDDLGVAEHATPPLTTLRNPIADMATEACRLLGDQMSPGAAAGHRHVVFVPDLVRRESA